MTNKPRRISEFLPEVLQTDILQKFFAATGDQLFQPNNVEYLSAFIGNKPEYYDPENDQYVSEINKDRTNYQLAPTTVSRDSASNEVTHTLFYDDLINRLRFQGALVNDHNRLFSNEYYSYGVPIDLDKFLNYQNYVWLPEGPPVITLVEIINPPADIEGSTTYSYVGDYYYPIQSNPDVVAFKQATVENPLVLSNGMKLQFLNDVTVSNRPNNYIVEGVGQSIRLVSDNIYTYLAWENPEQWDNQVWDYPSTSNVPNYVCIARGSDNANPWSLGNRWFHKDILSYTETTLDSYNKYAGKRPILEFAYNLKLWNFASRNRGFITLIDTTSKYLSDIEGKWVTTIYPSGRREYLQIDGITLDDNMVILFTNLLDQQQNNKLYRTTNIRNSYQTAVLPSDNSYLGQVILELLPNGMDSQGAPVNGDGVFVSAGNLDTPSGAQHVNTYWYFNSVENKWIQGQNRQITSAMDPTSTAYLAVLNQSPLFDLYDTQGTYLANLAVYPGSNFAGCTIFEYQKTMTGTPDPVLGFVPVTENESARNYVFENTISTQSYTYQNNLQLKTIPGYKFFAQTTSNHTVYLNNWYKSNVESRQYVVNEFVSIQGQNTFLIDQSPALQPDPLDPTKLQPQQPGPLPITVSVGTVIQTLNTDYTVVNNSVVLYKALDANQFVIIRSYAGLNNTATNGYFEIPNNLSVNPNNQDILTISMASLIPHFSSILVNQVAFVGSVTGSNNYRDLAQDLSLGTVLLENRAPMLKLMGTNAVNQTSVLETSTSIIDPFAAIVWAQSEYLRFYNKVVNGLMNLWLNQGYTTAQSPQDWLTQVLSTVNLGKTPASAWANSGFDLTNGAYCSQQAVTPTWVPASATRLGVTPAYYPEVFYDFSQPDQPLSMRTHNGAVVVLKDYQNQNLGEISNNLSRTSDPQNLTNPVAQSWLVFELNLYQSLPLKYKDPQVKLPLDPRTIFSGKYRTTSYTRLDQLAIQSPAWQKWLTFNQLDALRNNTFNITDPFSWNYSSCVDKDGQPVPGNWRGIYYWFYDTDQPDSAPWQMVGFSQKPSWWDQEYGAAPYTSGNLKMWQDLELGKIAQGPLAGTYTQWARPQLSKNIPVNSVGQLLPPFEAGVVTTLPSTVQASADWQFGDRSPLENVWLTQVDSDIQWAQWMYLTKPAQFMEYLWDGIRQEQIFADQDYSQYIYTDTLTRKSSADFYVHRENPQDVVSLPNLDNLTYYGSCGIQHWISERLVSDSRNVTVYLGNVIRGLTVNLAHRLGGFTDSQSTKLFVESFGLGGNNSLLLPQEDMSTELLRSSSTGEYVYTGVIVEFRGSSLGWRVIGYDSVNPYFTIVPSDTKGPKNTVVIDNQRVLEYSRGLKTTAQVAYGTIFATRQEVYDFLVSLGRAQESDGWIFDQYDEVAGRPRNWSLSAREFLFWSQGPWAAGTYITLSPLATLAKFSKEFGIIQNVGGIVNGTYSILDRSGQIILLKDLDFLRIDDQISVRPLNDQGIFGLRLYTTTLEHAFVFNNQTIFNDTVYDPVLNQRQNRVKLFGYRTLNWTGRMEAPGYIITQSLTQTNTTVSILNRIIPNYEKSVEDLRKLFEIDLATSYQQAITPSQSYTSTITQSLPVNLSQMAKNVVGYVPRPYLTDLLVDENISFQFYQGMIHQKGTATAINRLLRNRNVLKPNQDFNYYEEWAFRAAIYGNNLDNNSVDVRLDATKIQGNPQLFEVFGNSTTDLPSDDTYTIFVQDPLIIDKTPDVEPFKLRTVYGSQPDDLPTAGYVLLGETTYTVVDSLGLSNLYTTRINANLADASEPPLQEGDTVWQFIDPLRTWNVWKVYVPTWTILNTSPSTVDISLTEVTTSENHLLQDNDLVIIYGTINAGVVIDNTFTVTITGPNTFEINLVSTNLGSGGNALVYKSMRFANTKERDQAAIPGGWTKNDIVYVDGNPTTPWQVQRNTGTVWTTIRVENYKTDPQYINTSFLYDYTSGGTLANLVYWDPAKNKLPGIFDVEIAYKTPYDPAQYTNDPSLLIGTNSPNAWGNDQVGLVWWDLNTLRFIDYEIGTNSYRRQNWGSIAPGTTVDIYEWVRSTVPPASWQELVAKGTDLSAIGSTNLPTGQVKSDNQPYVERQQLNSVGQLITVYYFWVKNTTTVPDVSWRSISTSVLGRIIAEPSNSAISWWSAINSTATVVGNIGYALNGINTVWHISWLKSLDLPSVHKEYDLMRPRDPRSSPYNYLWTKLQNSLVEFDIYNDVVPSYRLTDREKYGIEQHPSQTMFEDRDQARMAFVTQVNLLLASAASPTATDVSRVLWREYFNAQEPIPAQRITKPSVIRATNIVNKTSAYPSQSGNLQAYYTTQTSAVRSKLIAQNTELLIVDWQYTGGPTIWNIEGYYPQVGDRILIKNQMDNTQNGIYTVVHPGALLYPYDLPSQPSNGRLQLSVPDPQDRSKILQYQPSQGQFIVSKNILYVITDVGDMDHPWAYQTVTSDVENSPQLTNWVLERVNDFDQYNDNLENSEVYVTSGSQQGYWTCNSSGLSLADVTIIAGGTDYSENDLLTIADAQASQDVILRVSGVDDGSVTSVSVDSMGNYTVIPPNAVVNLVYALVEPVGTGSGAVARITWTVSREFQVGQSAITFTQARSTTTWDQQVTNLAELEQLKYLVTPGTKILVADTSLDYLNAGPETNNRWSIWLWPNNNPDAQFVLIRNQSYVGSLCWSLTDWYSQGYSSDTVPDYVFDTPAQRDQFLDFEKLDIILVNNTGGGYWGLYLYVNLDATKWILIGEQNGTVVLNDNLYDYAKYNMGFDGAGYAQDFQGFEYDSRQELDNIIQGLWVGAQGTNGLLKIDNTINDPNDIFFTMLNRIFHEQELVDWAFKTSFINPRGFAEPLVATPYYTTSKINSLLEYINEIKPYHAKIRQFVDWKTHQDVWINNTSDFDKPPYNDPVVGPRILEPYNVVDANIMISNQSYKYWYENYAPWANPQLIRTLRTSLIFDRIACNPAVWYNQEIDPAELPGLLAREANASVGSLLEWLSLIYDQNIDLNYKAEVMIPSFVIMRRNNNSYSNDSNNTLLDNWDFIDYGLYFTQTYGLTEQQAASRSLVESQSIYTSQDLFLLIQNGLDYPSEYQVKVRIDDWIQSNTFIKIANTGSLVDWQLIAYNQNQGAINRILDNYNPSGTQTPLDSAYLISGCAGKLLTVEGAEFSNEDAWDKSPWDNIKGWDYSQDAYDPYDQNISDGMGPGYWIYVGDGNKTEFGLPVAPQAPNLLTVWLNGTPIARAGNWYLPNYVSQVYINNSGINYNTNDVIFAVGGTYVRPAQFQVTGQDLLGRITNVAIIDAGEYTIVPDNSVLNVTGGTGSMATLHVLWGGKTIKFNTAPSLPTQPRPNIWIVEKGSSFHPVVAGLLGTTFDGSGLNRPHLEPGHPEELNSLWLRDSLLMDVYTLPSAGYGKLVTKVYMSDGLLDQFDIGQPITNNYQMFVYMNGVPQTQGITADYVIAFDSMKVIFVNPPLPGKVSIISVGMGGASQGLGSFTILNPGIGYNIGDDITLDGGIPYEPNGVPAPAMVTVTAVKAVQMTVSNGGQDYLVGDILSLKYGYYTNFVVAKVTSVTSTLNTRGIISSLEIINPGYYLSIPSTISFFSSGVGTGAQITISWGVVQASLKDSGYYFSMPGQAGQLSVTPGTGTGFVVSWGPSAIRQQRQIIRDNTTSQVVEFENPIEESYVLVIGNGEALTANVDWILDSNDPRSIVLIDSAANAGLVYTITVFASKLSSLINLQTITVDDATQTSYVLDYPPGGNVIQSKNALVFLNGSLLTPPYFWQGTGDGITTVFNIGINTTLNPTIVAWENISTVAISAGPGAQQVTFAVAPAQGSQIYVEVDKDNDYTIVGDSIIFETGVLSNSDTIEIQTFSEDSSTRYTSDRWPGATSGIYSLSATPSNWGSIQVWVNGVLADSSWDYIIKVVDGVTEIQFGTQWAHTSNDEIQAFYYTGIPAQPAVAWRMFQNIFGDSVYQRLSNAHTTQLAQPLLSDDQYIFVQDGTVLADPNANLPGIIWVGNERIEYQEKLLTPVLNSPNQCRLGKLTRGSVGTSSGGNIQFHSEFHSGNGTTVYFKTLLLGDIQVMVDNQIQQQGINWDIVNLPVLNWEIEIDPPALVSGRYIKFTSVRINDILEDNIPAPRLGNNNITFAENTNMANLLFCYPSATLVRDGSARQNIPGGYIWTSGIGIQYGAEPQTEFLLEQTGTRQGK